MDEVQYPCHKGNVMKDESTKRSPHIYSLLHSEPKLTETRLLVISFLSMALLLLIISTIPYSIKIERAAMVVKINGRKQLNNLHFESTSTTTKRLPNYVAKLSLRASDMEAPIIGAQVTILLTDYSYKDFGSITGNVYRISKESSKEYTGYVSLGPKIVSSRGIQLSDDGDLKASSLIAIGETRLINTFLNSLISKFNDN